jgi:exopolyphosphatase/guanosine-5'-triphosphate,3'-diphosphate pyrophosphatase
MAMFDDGKITASKMESAILRGALEIRGVRKKYKPQFWDIAIGSSGTIKAIAKVIEAQGWGVETITADALAKLRKAIIKKKEIDKLAFEGLSDSRKPVFVGGVAVLTAVFNALEIQEMHVSTFALREGLLYELLGSMNHDDIRDATIEAFQQRFNVDSEYAGLVEKTAIRLLTQVENTWDLESTLSHQLLSWAAKTHEIGISLTHSAYQKHSAYILANAEMPGFTRQQQEQLATIVRNHRKKIEASTLESLTKSRKITVTRLIILLRIAIILHRGRTPGTKPNISIEAKEKKIKLHFPAGWLYRHPLNQAELEQEIGTLKKLGYSLKLINDD